MGDNNKDSNTAERRERTTHVDLNGMVQDDHRRRSSSSRRSARSSASVSSEGSSKFSETQLGRMLAKQGLQAPRGDFEVPIQAAVAPPQQRNRLDRVARRVSSSSSSGRRNHPPRRKQPHPQQQQNRRQDFEQILFSPPQPAPAVQARRAMPVYPTKLGLNDNLEIEVDGLIKSNHEEEEEDDSSGRDSGIVLIHDSDPEPTPPQQENIIEIDHGYYDETSAFDGDDLYMTEFGDASATQAPYRDNFRDEYHHQDEMRHRQAASYMDDITVSMRSTRSVPHWNWPARREQPQPLQEDPYTTQYRDNLMLNDEIAEFHELKREKMFQRRRWPRCLMWGMLVLGTAFLAVTVPVVMNGSGDSDNENPGELVEGPIPVSPSTPNDKTAVDPEFASDWSTAVAGDNVIRDYVLHAIVLDRSDNPASIVAPHGDEIWLYVMDDYNMGHECSGSGDPYLKTPGGDSVLLNVPMRDTHVVACKDNQLVAAVHHIFVDGWMGENHDYQMQVMDWNLPDYHKNQINHVFDFKQRHDTDRLYMLFVVRPDSNGRVLFVDGRDNVEKLYTSLTDHPRKRHHCDGLGLGFGETSSVWFTLAEETAATTDEPGYVLWELTPMLSGNHVDAWETLVWACDESSKTMQKPVAKITVENPDKAALPTENPPTQVSSTSTTTSTTTQATATQATNTTTTTATTQALPVSLEPAFQTNWTQQTLGDSVIEYVLHGVPNVETIHMASVTVHPLVDVYELPQPQIVTPQGPCNPNGDWGAVEMPADSNTARFPLYSRDLQIVSCYNGKIEGSVTHIFIPSWTEEQQPYQLQIIDFNIKISHPTVHFEAAATDMLYVLIMPKVPHDHVLYVDGAEAKDALQTVLTENPQKLHQCDGTGNGFDQGDAVWYADFESTVETNESPFLLWEITEIVADSSDSTWSTLAWLCNMDDGIMVKPVAEISVDIVS